MTGFNGSLGRQRRFAIIVGLPDVPRYAAARALLPPDGHEFVNKIRTFPEGYSKAMPSIAASAPANGWPPGREDFYFVAGK
jgi:hypothetical protein